MNPRHMLSQLQLTLNLCHSARNGCFFFPLYMPFSQSCIINLQKPCLLCHPSCRRQTNVTNYLYMNPMEQSSVLNKLVTRNNCNAIHLNSPVAYSWNILLPHFTDTLDSLKHGMYYIKLYFWPTHLNSYPNPHYSVGQSSQYTSNPDQNWLWQNIYQWKIKFQDCNKNMYSFNHSYKLWILVRPLKYTHIIWI